MNKSLTKVTREDAIIETMPFSKELRDWCKSYPDFSKALKINYPKEFLTLGAIVTSHSTYKPEDQVIGIYTYAYTMKNPIFKQDFVINVGNIHKQFILYTRFPSSSKIIKDISEFYKTYGENGNYLNSHHLTFDQLPDKVKFAGERAIELANRIIKNGLLKDNPKRNKRIYRDVLIEKQGEWFKKEKL